MQSVKNIKWIITLVVAAIMGITSCGGGAGSMGLDNSLSAGSIAVDDSVLRGNGSDDSAAHDAGDDNGRHLPGLPTDDKGGERSASAVESFPGSGAIESLNGTVVETSMVLASTETELAWALYKVEGLAGRKVTGMSIETLGGIAGSYSVGVSNYSEGVWEFLQSGSLPEFEIDFTAEQSRLTSEVGNLYFVVVASGGAEISVLQSTVFSRELEPGEEELPVFGKGIQASEGIADRITVSWEAIAGASSYELWREADIEGQDEVAELIATIPAVEGQASYSYDDMTVALSTEYKYRVRGANGEGTGEYTRWRSGWAGTVPPVCEDETGDDNGNDGIEDETGDDNGNDGIEDETGDDNGNDGTETGDDNGNDGTETGDDNGNDGTEDETGDDNGNDGTEDETGDDNGNDGTEDETGDDNGAGDDPQV
ncbi:hypothetical protein IT575_01945 [bacterium]|nr:hypothetical protein [bacterium]